MQVKSESEDAQLYPTLSDSIDYNLPGPSIHGIFQARVLEWVAITFSTPSLYLGVNIEHKVCSEKWQFAFFFGGGLILLKLGIV